MRSIWMHAWDLEGGAPEAVVDELLAMGLDSCNVAFKYHGGRVLLPRQRRPVRELDAGGVYFEPDPERYRGMRLQPRRAAGAELIAPFVDACVAGGLTTSAWVVACHDDRLGGENPDCCVQNVFGDLYPHALCPSHPDVREYVAALCGDVAGRPGLSRMDLEAVGFMGYEHGSLHDKVGVPLTGAASWLLSLCACGACGARMGGVLEEAAARARAWLGGYLASPTPALGDPRAELATILGEELLAALLTRRREVVATLLDEIRRQTGPVHLNLRVAQDPLFVGGKSVIDWHALPGRVDSATVTFFGFAREQMAAQLRCLPPPEERPVPLYGGFVFHLPDCETEEEIRARLALLREARVDGVCFYSLGLAAGPHLRWLASALAAEDEATGEATRVPHTHGIPA